MDTTSFQLSKDKKSFLNNADTYFETFVELLRWRALQQPNQPAFIFLVNGETEEVQLTYGELDLRARVIASQLQSMGVTGQQALLLYPPGLEFITAFFGCLYAGVVAVPAYPPRHNQNLKRLQAIVADARATIVLTKTSSLVSIQKQFAQQGKLLDLHCLATDNIASHLAQTWQELQVNSNMLAFLQYTSGSTGRPKGVMVTHGNLIYNSADLDSGWEHTPESVIVTWLPTFHDMGLIYGVLQPLYKGIPCYMMSPVSFLQRPMRWLEAISRYKATHSGAPNFAYQLCIDKITSEQIATLDLSGWRMALNGAEPVRADVLKEFAKIFEPCGFDMKAFCPGYGLAEATLKVTTTRTKDLPTFYNVQADMLVHNHVVEAQEEQKDIKTLVGCGRTEIDTKIAIVHPELLTTCTFEQVGEIWVSGSTIAQGYWMQTEATEQTFRAYLADTGEGPFLRTGDLGFLHNGELFVTGRLKDLIIIRGRNHYPQDIEFTVEKSHAALRQNCGSVFTIEINGEERLIVVYEIEREYLRNCDVNEINKCICRSVAEEHELQVQDVVLIKTLSIPKTSSGKIQRSLCKEKYLNGDLDVVIGITKSNQTQLEPKADSQVLVSRYLQGEIEFDNEKPIGETEKVISNIFCQTFKRTDISRNTSFFDLGGDSLAAVQIITAIESCGYHVEPDIIYEFDTIASLASILKTQLQDNPMKLVSPYPSLIATEEIKFLIPLSLVQERFWDDYLTDRSRSWANMYTKITLEKNTNIEAVKYAIDAIACRHSAIRVTFYIDNEGKRIQKIHQELPIEIEVLDITEDNSFTQSNFVDYELEFANRLFLLDSPPLFRICLVRQNAIDILLLCFHHLIADGWSMALLKKEICSHYHAYCSGDRQKPEPAIFQYQSYVSWQRKLLDSGTLDESREYWRNELNGFQSDYCIRTNEQAAKSSDKRGSGVQIILPTQLSTHLSDRAKELRASTGILSMTTLFILLAQTTGYRDLIVGTPLLGRDSEELKSIVGITINQSPIRIVIDSHETFASLVSKVRRKIFGAIRHQHFQTNMMLKDFGIPRKDYKLPITNVFFTQLPIDDEIKFANYLSTSSEKSGQLTDVRFDMMWYLFEYKNGYILECKYRKVLFSHQFIDNMIMNKIKLLSNLLTNPYDILTI